MAATRDDMPDNTARMADTDIHRRPWLAGLLLSLAGHGLRLPILPGPHLLTAATGDKRVKAIAPLVIDTLNMPVQMKNQVAAFGKPSLMVHDYVERKLIPIPDTPDAKKPLSLLDPWV